jgi:hypothetical protein
MAARRTWQVFLMLGGFIAWAVQFAVLYGGTSAICAREWAEETLFGIGVVPATIVGATLAALAAAAAILLHSLRKYRRIQTAEAAVPDAFLTQAAILTSALSLAAIAWHGLPALILPACA